jgi:peptidyl-prolyl cis-trans isomerase D
LDEQAQRLHLGQSDAETLRVIYGDPNFKGSNGAFDPARFQATIREFGFSEQRYLADQRKVSLRRQIAGAISAGIEPPKTMIEVLSRYQNERRTVDYVRLEAAQAGTIEAPSPEALASYFDDHKIQFRAPEYRKIAFVAVTPEEIGKWTEVSDADARQRYEQRRDKLGTPEKREVSQIVFPTLEEATAARARIAAGLSFDDLAKERDLKPGDVDLGMMTKSAIIDPAVAEAAFALPTGEVSQPVQGEFGVALVRIGKIEPGVVPSYESLAASLKKEIAIERAQKAVADLRDKMEDERGGGSNVIQAAQKLGLTAVTIDAVDRSGRLPDGQLAAIPKGLDLVSQAFNSDVGVDNDPIAFQGGYVWYDVLGITPSRERSLDEVKDQVEARWRDEQIASRLKTKANELVAKLEQGGKMSDEAALAGVKLESSAEFKRDGAVPGLPPAAIAAAFRTAKDGIGQAAGGAGNAQIVFRVTGVTVPPIDFGSDDIKTLKQTLLRNLTDEQIGEYVMRLETDIGVSINQEAFAQVTGAGNGTSDTNN